MKRAIIITIIMATTFFWTSVVHANALSLKLPYAKGQRFIVVQGYNTLPTHIGHDAYALDFSQNGCEAYGKPVAAVSGGTAMTVLEQGYNGGYGTEIVINHGNDLISRYAHMIPGSILVGANEPVRQGQVIGRVGDTGLVAGLACPDHPGTHLHFAMDIRASDGTLTAYKPEPISGYLGITAGNWYLSDNEEEVPTAVGTVQGQQVAVSGASIVIASSTVVASASSVAMVMAASTGSSAAILASAIASAFPAPLVIPSSAPSVTFAGIPIATSSVLPDATTSSPSSSPEIPPDVSSNPTLFEQSDDTAQSSASWYDDNWFDLGNGFSGTLNSLTLEGRVSEKDFLASHVVLQEFKDQNYIAMVQQFDISDDAPFTYTMATTTFIGLNIQLKPYFYYRLATIQDYQNRSVILAGTSATGTYMYNNFVYGAGRVESTGTFMPFMVMTGTAATSTPTPPALTTATNLLASFDELGMQLNLAWSTSIDPDWAANPLHYQINYSTSSVLSDAGWHSGEQIPVVVGNSYLIGVRAVDNYGAVSAPATTTWNFPPGFEKYYVSPSLSYATQDFTVPTTTILSSIEIFTTNLGTSARYPEGVGCSFSLTDLYGSSLFGTVSSDNGYGGYGCAGDLTYSFASSPLTLLPNDLYQWIFQASTGNPSTQAWVQFYGTAENTAGGFFSDPSVANARFVINGQSGPVFAN